MAVLGPHWSFRNIKQFRFPEVAQVGRTQPARRLAIVTLQQLAVVEGVVVADRLPDVSVARQLQSLAYLFRSAYMLFVRASRTVPSPYRILPVFSPRDILGRGVTSLVYGAGRSGITTREKEGASGVTVPRNWSSALTFDVQLLSLSRIRETSVPEALCTEISRKIAF